MNPYDKSFCDKLLADAKSNCYDLLAFVNGRCIHVGNPEKAIDNAAVQCAESPNPILHNAIRHLSKDFDAAMNSAVMNLTLRDLEIFVQSVSERDLQDGYYLINDFPGDQKYALQVYSLRNQINVCQMDRLGLWLSIGSIVFLGDGTLGGADTVQFYSSLRGTTLYDNPYNLKPGTKLGDISWVSAFPYNGNIIGDIIKFVMTKNYHGADNSDNIQEPFPGNPVTFSKLIEYLNDTIKPQSEFYPFGSKYGHFYPKYVVKSIRLNDDDPARYDIFMENKFGAGRICIAGIRDGDGDILGEVTIYKKELPNIDEYTRADNLVTLLYRPNDVIDDKGLEQPTHLVNRVLKLLCLMVTEPGAEFARLDL